MVQLINSEKEKKIKRLVMKAVKKGKSFFNTSSLFCHSYKSTEGCLSDVDLHVLSRRKEKELKIDAFLF